MADVNHEGIKIYKLADLISYRDPAQYPQTDLEAEMARVHAGTEVERQWLASATVFETDTGILRAVDSGELVRARPTVGIMPIQRLVDWAPERSDQLHEFHYSPPYMRNRAWEVAEFVGAAWSSIQRTERDESLTFLPLTSAVRSTEYQNGLTTRSDRKIAIDTATGEHSSHEYGWAFDIDAGGIYRYDPVQRRVLAICPSPQWKFGFDQEAALIAYSREDLRGILDYLKDRDIINYVEEVPGTKEWCFHICVNPSAQI